MSRRRRTAAYTAAAAAAMSDGPVGFTQRIAMIPRLARDTLSGRYDGMSKGRLALMAAALLYILLPFDLAPEALLSIPGLLDDAAIAAWLVAALVGATTAYRSWASGVVPSTEDVPGGRRAVIPGEVLSS